MKDKLEISSRLSQVAHMVSAGKRLADVGTDHGYIPVYLVKNQIIPSALAMDLRSGPLERAKEHVAQYQLQEKIECRLSDGFANCSADEFDCAVIAGMGGELMIHILDAKKEIMDANKEFILQPQSEIDKVRRYVHSRGYKIEAEEFLFDGGKYYTIMKILPGKQKFQYEYEYQYGQFCICQKNLILKEYLLKQQESLKEICIHLQNTDGTKAKNRLKELQEKIDQIGEALKQYESM